MSALIVCVCLFVCKSSESSGECVCASPIASCVFESYRGKRDLLEPDLLDLETLYKASQFLCLFDRQDTENLFVKEAGGMRGVAVAGALMESVGFHCRANDVRN